LPKDNGRLVLSGSQIQVAFNAIVGHRYVKALAAARAAPASGSQGRGGSIGSDSSDVLAIAGLDGGTIRFESFEVPVGNHFGGLGIGGRGSDRQRSHKAWPYFVWGMFFHDVLDTDR
jgi:hypothetical protein